LAAAAHGSAGDGSGRQIQIRHDYITLRAFTIADADKLIWIEWRDPKGSGFAARGNDNLLRDNVASANAGARIRFGGYGPEEGIRNAAIDNIIIGNRGHGLLVLRQPQARICGNIVRQSGLGTVNLPGIIRPHLAEPPIHARRRQSIRTDHAPPREVTAAHPTSRAHDFGRLAWSQVRWRAEPEPRLRPRRLTPHAISALINEDCAC
jgi:hypothetical protein